MKSASSLVGQIIDLHLNCGLLKSLNSVGITFLPGALRYQKFPVPGASTCYRVGCEERVSGLDCNDTSHSS